MSHVNKARPTRAAFLGIKLGLLAAALALLPTQAKATYIWIGAADDNWNNTANWVDGAISSSDGYTIFKSGTATLGTGVNATTDGIYLGHNSDGSPVSLIVDGGSLNTGADALNIGYWNSSATVTVNSGTLTAWGGIFMAANSNAPGALVQNGGLISALKVTLGSSAVGNITLNGGVLSTGELDGGTGTLTLNGGTIQANVVLNNDFATGFTAGQLVVGANGGTIDNNGNTIAIRSDLSGTSALNFSGAGITVLGTSITYGGNLVVNSGTLQLGDDISAGSVAGNIVNNGAVNFYSMASSTYGSVISGTGGVSVTTIAAPVVFTGENTYSGGTYIGNNANLKIGDGGTKGSIVGDVVADGSLTFNHSDAVTFTGTISGAGNLYQVGSGTTTLTGTNTYSGVTQVDAGKLVVNGALNTDGWVNVNSGAAFGGSGTAGNLVVTAGTVTPGSGSGRGTLSLTSLQLDSASTLALAIDGTSAGSFDQLKVSMALSIAGTLSLSGLGHFTTPGASLLLIQLDGPTGISGIFDHVIVDGIEYATSLDGNGLTVFSVLDIEYALNYAGGDGNDLTLTVVPEPSTYGMLAIGLGLIMAARLRRRALA